MPDNDLQGSIVVNLFLDPRDSHPTTSVSLTCIDWLKINREDFVIQALTALQVQKTTVDIEWWRTPSFRVQHLDAGGIGPNVGTMISTCRQWEIFCAKAAVEVSDIAVSFNQEDIVYAEGYY
jgi:hypothetical protein